MCTNMFRSVCLQAAVGVKLNTVCRFLSVAEQKQNKTFDSCYMWELKIFNKIRK